MPEETISVEEIKAALKYDKKTGEFFWRRRKDRNNSWNNRWAGEKAGSKRPDGYLQIFFRKSILSHRLAWFYVHGEWPDKLIDHINGDRLDNRIENLRVVSNSINLQNKSKYQKNNKSTGMLGVSVLKNNPNRFAAQIFYKGKQIKLGYYKTKEEAFNVYINAKRKYHEGFVETNYTS